MAESREYKSVLVNLSIIRDHLQMNRIAKELMTLKYQQHIWLSSTANPNASDLTVLALNRISTDASQYHIFMDMLKSVVGLDIIVKKIEGI